MAERCMLIFLRVTLLAALALIGFGAIDVIASRFHIPSISEHFAVAYIVGTIVALSFPTLRRYDITMSLIVVSSLFELAVGAKLGEARVLPLFADIVGLLLLYLPTTLDQARKRLRTAAPDGVFWPGFFGRRPLAIDQATESPGERRRPLGASVVTMAIAASAGCALVTGIAFATLCPQSMRPHLGNGQIERFGAFFVTAAAFASAFPRRPVLVATALVGVAIGLELSQLLVPGRDAGVPDAIEKSCGAVVGSASAWLARMVVLVVGSRQRAPTLRF
jgi:hypothetical protein